MNGNELGKRIKEARLARKMTQTDVVGTFITRNMLSQIEGGTAYPSVKTLEYLAKVLELPMNYLIPDEDILPIPAARSGADAELTALISAKNAYREGLYDIVIDNASKLCGNNGSFEDEGLALLCRAYLGKAKKLEAEGQLQQAIELAKKSLSLSGEGVYSSREVKTAALLLLDSLAEALSQRR